jgi:phosphoglycerol transferase MdoB-like AlkP superfamily enzyme
LKRLTIILFAYAICRAFFLLFNAAITTGLSYNDYAELFFYGIRFDIFSILITNIIFILAHILPLPGFYNAKFQKVIKILFYTFNIPALLFNLIDCVYFNYTQKRTTADFFTSEMAADIRFTIVTYLKDFWYLLLILIIMVAGIEFIYSKIKMPIKPRAFRFWPITVGFIISSGLFILGARGGIQYKPISMQAAARYTSQALIPAMLNTPFSIIKTRGMQALSEKKFMPDQEAELLFPVYQKFSHDSMRRYNVVILIMESFSKEFCGYFNNGVGYTPFLDSLCKNSLVFTNAYANSKRSIEGIPAIVASIPHLMDESFISSAYNTNAVEGIAGVLKKEGYEGYFFHGGNNGTMGFENFCPLVGFDKYYGRNEYDGPPNDYDGNWGIYDGPFLNFVNKKLNVSQQPFCAAYFSLSSHHPYVLPEKYIKQLPEGTPPMFESFRYADQSLQHFFENASKSNWFKNTLFVITADHTGQAVKTSSMTSKGSFEIPIILYCPSDSGLKGVDSSAVQQTDILPTVLDYLHYHGKFASFGHSMFSNDNGFAINYINNIYQGINNRYLVLIDGETGTSLGYYDYHTDVMLKKKLSPAEIKDDRLLLKTTLAAIQQFRLHIRQNDLNK